jgi:prepilin-type N-terminal cleavage/methylation domain-containing protein/prepilin-type processing-associated H-X9-DG protein
MSQIIGKRGKKFFWHGAAGFTLVEVVVVIGILALLCAMLFPMVARTRAGANQVRCLSNLGQIFTSIKMYAGDNNDQIPLGYIAGVKQMDYVVYNQNNHTGIQSGVSQDLADPKFPGNFTTGKGVNWGIGHTVTTLGLLVPTYASDGTVFYCPADTITGFQFNTAENPWPFPLDHDPKNYQQAHTRIGYSQRPVANFGNQFFPIRLGPDGVMYVPAPFPKLAALGSKAILADTVSTIGPVTNRHVDGVNVLYADGAAGYAPLTQFATNLNTIGDQVGDAKNATFLDDSNPDAPSGVWADLDRCHPAP